MRNWRIFPKLVTYYLLLLQIIFDKTVLPKLFVLVHTSTLIKLGHIRVKLGLTQGYNLGQWVIRVSESFGSMMLTQFQPDAYKFDTQV